MPTPVTLLDALPGPWVGQSSDLPPGGPRSWWCGPGGVVIGGPPERIAAERAGLARLGEHPARPRLLASSEDAIALPPLGPPPTDPAAVVASWPRGKPWVARVSGAEGLALIPGRTDPGRGLVQLKIRRRDIDRFLVRTFDIASHRGPSLGGLHGGWLRACDDGVVALRWSGADPDGISATDLACTGLDLALKGDLESLQDLRESHRDGLPESEADRAFDLALLRRALDEFVLGSGESATIAADFARATFERLTDRINPDCVAVRLTGAPRWLDTSPWLSDTGQVPAARARWLLQNVHGLVVGEDTLHVSVEAPIRAGRRPPQREDRALRRRRLFHRWNDGIRTDEEGLYSATPEALADRVVASLSGVVMDGTAGVGSLALALGRNRQVTQVLAVDTHAGRLDMARHNARIYGLESRIQFLCQDVAQALRAHPCDALVLDPPWGGRNYDREHTGMQDLGLDLVAVLSHAPRRVIIKLPRSFVCSELESLVPGPWSWSGLIDDRGQLKLLCAERS